MALRTTALDQLASAMQRLFRRKLPQTIAQRLWVKAHSGRLLVCIDHTVHPFDRALEAYDFLQTIQKVNEDAEYLQFDKVFPRCLARLNSIQ